MWQLWAINSHVGFFMIPYLLVAWNVVDGTLNATDVLKCFEVLCICVLVGMCLCVFFHCFLDGDIFFRFSVE